MIQTLKMHASQYLVVLVELSFSYMITRPPLMSKYWSTHALLCKNISLLQGEKLLLVEDKVILVSNTLA